MVVGEGGNYNNDLSTPHPREVIAVTKNATVVGWSNDGGHSRHNADENDMMETLFDIKPSSTGRGHLLM